MSKGSPAKNVWEPLYTLPEPCRVTPTSAASQCCVPVNGAASSAQSLLFHWNFIQHLEQGTPAAEALCGSETLRGRNQCKLGVNLFIWADGAQLTTRLIYEQKKIRWKDLYKAILIIFAQACSEILSRTFKLLPFTSAWPLLIPWCCHPPTQPMPSLKPAPWGIFLSHLSSRLHPFFWFFGPKASVILDLFLLSYPTFNQLVKNPGSFAFKIDSKPKPLHSFPASTLA